MNIDNALVLMYDKQIMEKDEEKEIYKLIPIKIVKGYIENNIFYTYENENDEIICYDYIEKLEDGKVLEEKAYAFPLDLDKFTKEQQEEFAKDYEEFEKLFKEQELYLAKRLSDNLIKTVIIYDENKGPEEIKMKEFSGFLEIYDTIQDNIENSRIMPTDELYNIITKDVLCQEEQIKNIITIIAKNQRIKVNNLRSNILLCGPTGVGKSQIFNTLYNNSNIPIAFEDACDYKNDTHKSLNDMLINLYLCAGENIERAQRGIIVVDNLDTNILYNNINENNCIYDFMTELKKYMSGASYMIQTPTGEYISFDTSTLTFILIGNFQNIKTQDVTNNPIGFQYQEEPNSILDEANLKRLNIYPEFIPNDDNIITFNNLDIQDLIKIIKESEISELLLYKKLLKENGIELSYNEDLIEEIAKEAYKLNIGAKGIKKIVEKIFKDANYYIFSSDQYQELTINNETVHNNKKYTLK